MSEIIAEVVVVIALILLNGFFAGSEMAFVSLRKSRVKQLVRDGVRGAVIVEKLQKDPEQFLATVQVGITLIGVIASAYAGASIAEFISPFLENSSLPFIAEHAEALSLTMIIISITYLTLILGELVPKSMGIKYSERFTLLAVFPIYWLSRIAFPIMALLAISSNLILRIFSDKTSFTEAILTGDELRAIIKESHQSGVLKKHEHEILDNVFDFSHITIAQVMTPRSKIFALDSLEATSDQLQSIIESGYSRVPFYEGGIDNIIGVLYTKDLLHHFATAKSIPVDLSKILQSPTFVPNTQKISELLRKFQRDRLHLAIVTDEHGDVDGLITIEDILEEIVGEISDENDEEERLIIEQKDGSYLVDGSVSIVDFNRMLKTSIPEDRQYTTISGLLLEKTGSIPNLEDRITFDDIAFIIKGKTERTIKSIKVRLPAEHE